MLKLQTRKFAKWASRQHISEDSLIDAIKEVEDGLFDAHLGPHLYKKRIAFEGKGKSGGGRTIICYKKNNRIIFIHGFAKNETSNLSKKELLAFKELSKILIELPQESIDIAIGNGNFVEVTS